MTVTDIEQIFSIVQTLLTILGINIFVSFRDLNIFQKIYRAILAFIIIFTYDLEFLYFIWYYSNQSTDIGKQFMVVISFIAVSALIMRITLLLTNRKELLFLISWIKDVHLSVHERTSNKASLAKTGQFVLKLWKYSLIFLINNTIFTAVAIYGFSFIQSSFEFIVPVYLPFIPKDSPFYYSLNFWHQIFCYSYLYAYIVVEFLIFFTLSTHILLEMDLIKDICKKLGDYEVNSMEARQPTSLNNSDLHKIIEVKSHKNRNMTEMKGSALLGDILDRHNKIIEVVLHASNLYFYQSLLWEFATAASVCYAYYLIAIYQGYYYLAIGCLFIVPQYLICSVNGSNILHKSYEIARTLYDSNWLNLNVNDKKTLVLILKMMQKSHTLTVGGFADVSLARFTFVRSCEFFFFHLIPTHI